MVPDDLAEGSQLYEDALRIRIRHLVRDREHRQANAPAQLDSSSASTRKPETPGLDEADLEAQMLAVQQNEVMAKVLEDFVGPDDELDPSPVEDSL